MLLRIIIRHCLQLWRDPCIAYILLAMQIGYCLASSNLADDYLALPKLESAYISLS